MNRYIGLIAVAWLSSASLYGANLPSGFFETEIASGLFNPTAMALAPDGRIFVCEQWGSLRVIKNGTLLSTSFVDLAVSFPTNGEAGLLGVAVDPNFTSNQYLYVYYTATTPAIHNRISRFTAAGDVAVPGSEVVILELDDLSNAIAHNGGAIHFGPDGRLYAAVGENAFGPNAQTLNNLLGKILRLNPDGTIPADNPFYHAATGNNRAIWALGLRNPFTFAFQPGTGRMFINDVGYETWEEINEGIAGSNYGWPDTEGPTNESQYRTPFFAYSHGGTPSGCAITGGVFYNPSFPTFPAEYLGNYFFSDLCSGWINRLDPNDGSVVEFATDIGYPLNLQVGPDGSLYYLAFGLGSVFRIDYTANPTPGITRHPASQTVSVGLPATFSVTASGAQPLYYQWQQNGNNISGASSSSYTIAAQFSDSGALFRCVVTNSYGSATSNEAVLTVTGNSPPTGSITQPTAGTIYTAGNTIGYAGIGTDSEDGTLPASAFTWRVDFHHDNHFHPFVSPTSGSQTGSFVIPTTGETSPNVWYRIHLTVQDSGGLTHSSFRDILPRVSTVSLATVPSGLQMKLDGQPVTTPFSFVGVAGLMRNLEAVSPQNVNATTWTLVSWSDGGAAAHNIATPATNTTFTATYNNTSTTAPAQMTSPTPGSTLTSSVVTFTWSAGSGVSEYWLEIGTSPGGYEFYTQSQGASLSVTVSGLSTNGSTLYVRLWSKISGVWQSNDYTYTAASGGNPTKAQMTSPTPGSTLTSSVVTFTWSAGSGVSEYWVYIGTSPGGYEFYTQSQGASLSVTVSGLSSNGSTLYVRLWSKISGVWQSNDYTYTAASGGNPTKAQMTSPAPGSTLTSSVVSFTWSAGSGVSEYWVYIGTSPGGYEFYTQSQGASLSVTVSGLSSNGSTLYVRLWSKISGVWQSNDYTYTAASGGNPTKAQMTSPAPGSTLTSSVVSFTWSVGSGVSEYWVYIGTSPGGYEFYTQSQGASLSVTVSGLPTNGSTFYVRLWSQISGVWQSNDYIYTAAN